MKSVAGEHKILLERFLNGGMTAVEFQCAYLDKFQSETRTLDEDLFLLLDALFCDVDAFESDPKLLAQLQAERSGFYLDEQSLRNRVSEVLQRLLHLPEK